MFTPAGKPRPGDTLLQNNKASAFTFVQGQGRVLYVDNSRNGAGETLFAGPLPEGVRVVPLVHLLGGLAGAVAQSSRKSSAKRRKVSASARLETIPRETRTAPVPSWWTQWRKSS